DVYLFAGGRRGGTQHPGSGNASAVFQQAGGQRAHRCIARPGHGCRCRDPHLITATGPYAMKASSLAFVLDALASLLMVALALFAYHRYVVQPALRIGVVDVAEVYRGKESEFTQALTRADSLDAREQAMRLASDFARKLPRA